MAKTIKRDRAKWEDLQRKAQEARDADTAERIRLQVKYSAVHYASTAERKRLEVLQRAAQRAGNRLYAYLAAISPRDWSTGVPVSWIIGRLTFDDATTAGQLAMIPDPAWGSTQEDARRFAQPVKS